MLRQLLRLQVADRVHQAAGADRHHRIAEVFKPDENAEIHAEMIEAFGRESEIVDRVFHADEIGAGLRDFLQCVECDRHRGAARDVIDHPRQRRLLAELFVIFHKAALGRAGVIGRDDQQRIGAGFFGMGGKRAGFLQVLRPGRGDDRQLAGIGLNRDIDDAVAFLDRQRRGLRRGAVDQNAVRAVLDLEFDQSRIGVVIDLAVLERRDQRRDGSLQEILGQFHHGRGLPVGRLCDSCGNSSSVMGIFCHLGVPGSSLVCEGTGSRHQARDDRSF